MQQIITHTFPWVVMKYDLTQTQHDDVVENVPQLFTFPEGALDREVSSLAANIRNGISNKLTAIGFDTSWIASTTTLREVLQNICHSIQLSEQTEMYDKLPVLAEAQNFDLRTKTVGDIPTLAALRIRERMETNGIDTSWVTTATPIWQIVRRIQRHEDGATPRINRQGQRWFYHDISAD